MTIGIEMVCARAWSDEDLRAAVSTAWVSHGLGNPEITGEVETNLLIEVATTDLQLQVFKPYRRTTLAGPRWVTAMAVAASSSDELVAGVMTVAAQLARQCGGYVAVEGEVVDLEGVPSPTTEELTADAPGPRKSEASPYPPVFAAVMLDVPAPDDDGWRSLVSALGTWAGERRDWLPRWWRPDAEWEPFDPKGPAPTWWPQGAQPLSTGATTSWKVRGAGFPDDLFSQLSLELREPADAAAGLLDAVAALESWRPVYAMVHPWHDQEPFLVDGPRRDARNEPPYLMLGPKALLDGLPNVYWGNVLADPWVEAIGADRIASTPAYRVEEVLSGRWLIQLTEHPLDVLEDWAGFSELREKVKQHLGADLFREDDGYERFAPRPLPIPTLRERGLVK